MRGGARPRLDPPYGSPTFPIGFMDCNDYAENKTSDGLMVFFPGLCEEGP
jgi:hypothetical protein